MNQELYDGYTIDELMWIWICEQIIEEREE